MEKIAHTPTPWSVGENGENLFGETIGTSILNAEGYGIADTSDTCIKHRWYDNSPTGHWGTDPDGHIHLAEGEAEANAAFIVRACNAHDDLVGALEHVSSLLAVIPSIFGDDVLISIPKDQYGNQYVSVKLALEHAHAVIAKAKGGTS